MESKTNLSCEEFIKVLASKEPTPGGGGAAALMGGIGMALGNMVGSLTVGKKKYAAVEQDIISLQKRADLVQNRFIELVTKDAEVFEPLSKAYGLPGTTDEEKSHKTSVLEKCLRDCCDVPLEIMKTCCEAIDIHELFAEKGTAIAISDVGCGVLSCAASLRAASLNVFVNTKLMTDRQYAEDINKTTQSLLDEYLPKAENIAYSVEKRLR